VVEKRHCGTAVLMCVAAERTRSDRPCLWEPGMGGSENPCIPMWGMGGAAAVLPVATAARRADTGATSTTSTARSRSSAAAVLFTPAASAWGDRPYAACEAAFSKSS